MVKDALQLDATFRSLSDPTRRDILKRLTKGEMTVGEIAKPYTISLAAISKHLKALEKAGIIVKRRQGVEQVVSLSPAALKSASDHLQYYKLYWESSLDSLTSHLIKGDNIMTDHTITLNRTLNAPITRVFQAWVDPADMKKIGPAWVEIVDVTSDLRVGGERTVTMRHENETFDMTGEYLEISEPTKLVFTMNGSDSVVTIDLKAINDNTTELTLTHTGLGDEDNKKDTEEGWTSALDAMTAHLSKHN